MKSKLAPFLIIGLCLYGTQLLAHDQPVHVAITLNAAASALHDSTPYAGFIDTISSDCDLATATKSIAVGSWDEDFADQDAGGKRSLNHFYDPLTGQGLSDIPVDTREVVGTNSFTWASISNCLGFNYAGHKVLKFINLGQNENKSNIWSWQNARGYEWLGLTATNQTQRQTNLDNMFRAVGQVMHLLEDTSQPQHVRNETEMKG